ncbi:MAG: VWA domain-containing protein [Gammaproteobacteria bacterium]|nr:VWA domain-containing protein [Gammaproteobacteria bacterium]
MRSPLPLQSDEILAILETCFEVEYTFLHCENLAMTIAALKRPQQQLLLDSARRVAATQIQLAYELTCSAVARWEQLTPSLLESWAIHTLDAYDRAGLRAAMALVTDIDFFYRYRRQQQVGVVLGDEQQMLGHFLHALAGRPLAIAASELLWCDSETLYLPPVLMQLESRVENRKLYQAMAVFLWAQTRFGTFMPPLFALPLPLSDAFLALFATMDRLRLEAAIQRELPGQWRALQALSGSNEALSCEWQQLQLQLSEPACDVATVITLCQQHLGDLAPLPAPIYQGTLNIAAVAKVRQQRIERERALFKVQLTQLRESLPAKNQEIASAALANPQGEEADDATLLPDGGDWWVEQLSQQLPEGLKKRISSIKLDFGEIPPEYLTAAGPGEYELVERLEHERSAARVWEGTYHEEGASLYDEWDYRRQEYHKRWCALRELTIEPQYDTFVQETRQQFHHEIAQLRRRFEALRDENRLLRRQNGGEDIDIDALVEAESDRLQGVELSEALYLRHHRHERHIAVLFMVDVSGSTRGWINQLERQALVLMCEALETLGDRYAIYGFSGMTRQRCEIYRVKSFSDAYDATVQGRISALQPKDYTRMGAAIRHLSGLLQETEAHTRILVTLSDGRPDDYGGEYQGIYGIEDTRMALLEARRSGIHPYCITIDEQAQEYLPRLYGDAAYTLISDISQLPYQMGEIYQRLTR